MSEKYHIVQIGAGHQSDVHVTAVKTAGHLGELYDIVGVTDLHTDPAQRLARRISETHTPFVSTDVVACIKHILEKFHKCIPVICTSVKAHEMIGNLIAHNFDRRQIPGVIFEKPFGGCPEAGQRLHQLFQDKGITIGVQEQMYYSEVLQQVKYALSDIEIFQQLFGQFLTTKITTEDIKIREMSVNFSKDRRYRTFQFPTPNLEPPEWIYFEGPHMLAIIDIFLNDLGHLIHVEGKHMESPIAKTRNGWREEYSGFVEGDKARVPFHGGGSMETLIGNVRAKIISDLTAEERCRIVEFKLGKGLVLRGYLDAGKDTPKNGDKRMAHFELLENGKWLTESHPFEDNSLAKSLITLAHDIHHGKEPLSSAKRNIALALRQKEARDKLWQEAV